MTKKKIWVNHGRMVMNFILVEGPIPKKEDTCTINGADWTVTRVEDVDIVASFSTKGGKLKQVFPVTAKPRKRAARKPRAD